MLIFIESRAFQHERTCIDHHICQLWSRWCICSVHYYNYQSLLPQRAPSCRCYVASTNHSGIKHTHTHVKCFYVSYNVSWHLMQFSCLVMDGLVRSETFLWIRLTCGGLQPLSKSLYSGKYCFDLSRSFFPYLEKTSMESLLIKHLCNGACNGACIFMQTAGHCMRRKREKRENVQGCNSLPLSSLQALLTILFLATFSLHYQLSPLFAGYGSARSPLNRSVQG